MPKILKIAIIVTLALLVVGGGIFGYRWLDSRYAVTVSEAVNQRDNAEKQLTEINAYYEPLGGVIIGYAILRDMPHGAVIEEQDLSEIQTAASDVTVITDIADLLGKYYRVDTKAGTILNESLIMEFPVENDERAFDVITDFNAIGLAPNDFVDIRFQLPNGNDYLAIAHKRVAGIYGGVLKLVMSEYDIMVYNSLRVDTILFRGGIIYSTKYLEPGGQDAATENYPMSQDIMLSVLSDPNSGRGFDGNQMIKDRIALEEIYLKYADDEVLMQYLEAGKTSVSGKINTGEQDYRAQLEIQRQRELEEALIAEQEARDAAYYGG